jgi:putative peptidoglycan lipid II flippase
MALALGQVLIATTLVLANRVEGGVVAYQIAFTAFLLPYAVLAHPVLTTLYPRLVADAAARRWRRFADSLGEGVRTIAFLVLPAAALAVVLGGPALRLVRLGALDDGAVSLVARVLAAYAVGLAGYAGVQLLTRASYASDDARTPALVNLGITVAGSALMLVGFTATSGDDRVVALGLAHSAAMLAGAGFLLVLLRRRLEERWPLGAALARATAGAVAAGLVAAAVVAAVPGSGRLSDAMALLGGGAAGVATYVAVQWALRAPEPTRGGRLVPEAVAR